MTPLANSVIIQAIFKSVYIVFKPPEAPFTVRKNTHTHIRLSAVFTNVEKLVFFKGLLAGTAYLSSFLHLYTNVASAFVA